MKKPNRCKCGKILTYRNKSGKCINCWYKRYNKSKKRRAIEKNYRLKTGNRLSNLYKEAQKLLCHKHKKEFKEIYNQLKEVSPDSKGKEVKA